MTATAKTHKPAVWTVTYRLSTWFEPEVRDSDLNSYLHRTIEFRAADKYAARAAAARLVAKVPHAPHQTVDIEGLARK